MRRWLRRLLLTVTAAAVLLAVAAGVSLLLLQTPAAKRLLAEHLAVELASATGFGVEIGGIDGVLPFSAEAIDIRFSDSGGPWLTVDRLAVAWRPSALLAGRLHVTHIVAGEVALDHAPAMSDMPEDEPSPGLDLAIEVPRLPLPTEIDELRIERLALGPQVLGTAAVLQATGHASLGGGAREAALALDVTRIDGAAGQVRLQLAQGGAPALLTLAADVDEPAGGLIARTLSLPGLPPVSLRLAGDGPATAWHGRLAAAAGAARLDADLAVAVDETVALELDGRAQEVGGLTPDLAAFVPPSVDVAAHLRWQPDRRLDVERVRLAAREATAELSGGLDLDSGRIEGSLDLEIADAARWRSLLTPASIRTARLAGSLSGTLDAPAFQLEATVDGLAAPEVAAAQVRAKLSGTAALKDRHVVTDVSITADGRSSGLVLGIDPQLAALIGDSATWSLQAALDLVGGGVEIGQAKVAAKDVTVDAAGSIGSYGRAVDATVQADLADVAPVAALLDLPAAGSLRATAKVSGDALAPQLSVDVNGGFTALALGDPTLGVLLGSAPTFAATIGTNAGRIDIGALTITGAAADVTAGGRMAMDGGALELNVATTVAEIAPVAATLDIAARGGLAGRVQLTRTPEHAGLHFTGTAETNGFVVDETTATLLGPEVQATAEGTFGPDGIELAAARIEGAAAQLDASGRIGDTLALDYRLALPRLAALSPLAGLELEGAATLAGSVSGPSASPVVTGSLAGEALRIADVDVAAAEGSVSARDLAGGPQGDVALSAVAREQRLSLVTSYRVRPDGGVALDALRLTGPATSLSGDLVLLPAGLLQGSVSGRIGDLAPLGALVGESAAGAADIDVTFAPAARGQAVDARLEMRDLSLAADGAPLSAARLTLTADLDDAFGAPEGRAELRMTEAATGELRLAQTTIAAAGNARALDVQLSASGTQGRRPMVLDAAGELALDEAAQRLRLDRLEGSFDAIAARLNAPVVLSHEGDVLAIADLDAAVGAGHLTGGGRIDADQADLRLSLADLPLDILAAFAPQLDLGGTASAELRLAGAVAAPAAHADIRLADLRVGGTGIGETVGVAGALTLDLRDGRGSATARFGGPPDFALDGQASVPLTFSLQPFTVALAESAPIDGTVDGRIDLGLVPQIVDLRGDSLGGRLDVDMTLGGTLAAPRLVGEARIAGGSYLAADGGIALREVEAVAAGDNDRIVLRSLTARDGGEGRLTASGAATLGGVAAARYEGDVTLVEFAIPGGGDGATTASGHVVGKLELAAADAEGRRRFAATADARDLTVDGRSLDVFGPELRATLAGAVGADDVVIETARAEGADGALTASGRIAEMVDLDYRLELQRLAALSPLAGIELGGGAEVAGRITGPAQSPDATATLSGRSLRVGGITLDSASANINARDLGNSPQGAVDLALVRQAQRATLATPFRLREDGAVALDDLKLTAPQTALTGRLALSPLGLLDGRLRGEARDLAWLGPFVGQPVAGAATLDLAFTPTRRAQGLTADLEMRKLSLAAGNGAPLSVERATLTAVLSDLLGRPGGRAELRIDQAASGTLSLSHAALTAEGAGKALQVRLDATGAHGEPFDIAAAGELSLAAAAQRLRLDRLDARFGPVDARLNAPPTLSRDGRGFALDGLDAAVGKGRVTGGGRLDDRRIDVQLALADLPLDIVTAFSPALEIGGSASADLRLAGTPAAPTAHGEIRLAGLRSGGAKIGESVALDGTVTLDLQRGRGSVTARFGGPSNFALDGDLALPVAFRIQPFALDVAPAAPLAGRIAGRIDLGLVPQVVDLHGDALDGQFDLDMTVGGTRAAPRFVGEARIADGSYASAEAGTVLRNIAATVAGDTERIRLQSLTATDGGTGRLSASGTVVLGGPGGGRYDGELTLERFTVLNRSDAVATASGRLRLEEATPAPRLAGAVTVESAELRIPESLPPDIVKLDVVEVNLPPGRTARAASQESGRSPAAGAGVGMGLAVDVGIPGRAFLRGRGVDTEWRGNLRVAGTTARPDITGQLEVVRGGVDLLGAEFKVESGTVTFIGGDKIDPDLDVSAVAEANDTDARVHVTGLASAPTFEIGSTSGLPPEEAMARLLFGQSAGSLSPAQAVQLAQAAAALSGRGPGVLDKLRRGVGLDVLSVESTGPEASDTSIKAGKYISDKVFLKVEQGMTQESREVGVEVRVLPQVTVEGGVGHEGNGRVGVNWRYDY